VALKNCVFSKDAGTGANAMPPVNVLVLVAKQEYCQSLIPARPPTLMMGIHDGLPILRASRLLQRYKAPETIAISLLPHRQSSAILTRIGDTRSETESF